MSLKQVLFAAGSAYGLVDPFRVQLPRSTTSPRRSASRYHKANISSWLGANPMKTNRPLLIALAIVATGAAGFVAGMSVGQENKMNNRVYELRTYTTLPGRLPALHKRFSEHTIKLFEKQGMRNGLYWVPTDEARRDTTLIYFVVHESQEAADRSWKAFQADPEWIKARDASEAD